MCSLAWHSEQLKDQAVVVVVLIIAFLIPTLVLISAYTRVFRVAKRAACGVAPQQVATLTTFPDLTPAAAGQSPLSATDQAGRLQARDNLFPLKPSIQIHGASPSRSADHVPDVLRANSRGRDNEDSGIRTDSRPSISPQHNDKAARINSQRHLKSVQCKIPCICRPDLLRKISPVDEDSVNHQLQHQTRLGEADYPRNGRATSPIAPSRTALHSPSAIPTYKVRPSHVKAFKTLLAIVLTHLLLWSPFFACQLHALAHHKNLAFPLDATVTWLSYVSYAVNPCLYGCLNRGVREELVRHLGYMNYLCCCYFSSKVDQGRTSLRCGFHVPCKPRPSPHSSEDGEEAGGAGEGGAESFFQFLQRTQADGE
ncbi:class a rhodopsin g-protein coupled receptor gpr5ht4 [Elysia marginata]|uniref:Class a rhodopsin g-protein coupled receptor gpr5ht4 n=1 Tax=Elysia marginata TaxID=1093978 RepID=A0AAV4JWH6_9GAST|nr:class a rhodopsin g-protein coupled receptor gpr5ht4 [Elysia marginata]